MLRTSISMQKLIDSSKGRLNAQLIDNVAFSKIANNYTILVNDVSKPPTKAPIQSYSEL